MVYFACCNDKCGCVDPLIVTPSSGSTEISGASAGAGASSSSFSGRDMAVASVSVVCGVGATLWMTRKSSNNQDEQQQATALQMTLMTDAPQSL